MPRFNIGDRVIVLGQHRPGSYKGGADETFPEVYRGRVGTVRGIIDDHGASDADPLYRVNFPHMRGDAFWDEELSFSF